MDPQRVVQIKAENSLIGNKRRTGKLHCLLISHRVPRAVSPITDAANRPCTASSFLCTPCTSISCCGSAGCPPRLGLSPLLTYGFALLSATCTWQATQPPGGAWPRGLGSWAWMGERERQQICPGGMNRWAWIQRCGANATTGILGHSGRTERHPCKPDMGTGGCDKCIKTS